MSEPLRSLITQTEELCSLHDHITRGIARLEIPVEAFSDQYPHPNTADFEFESVVAMFLYQYARGFTQSELYRRLKGAAYVWIHFDLSRPPTQQAISYIWRNRLSLADRRVIKATARAIQDIASDHDIIADGEPRLDPETVDSTEITDNHIMDAVETAREWGLDEFDSKRAANATFEDIVFFERQAYLNMADRGTTTRSVGSTQRFERLSDREGTPHPDTHLRTMKQTATPPAQTTLNEYENGRRPAAWQRIRDEVLLDEVGANGGLREPAIAAIDITPWPVYASPYKDDEDVTFDDDSVVVNGEERYPRDNYPKMVHGLTGKHERGYAMATITIIGENTPIVLGIEPVRRESQWETEPVKKTSQADLVERLLDQAAQHVDIHKVFCDGGFDSNGVRDVIDCRDITYLIPKRRVKAELEDIETLQSEAVTEVGVIRDVPHGYYGRVHTGSIMYVPSTKEENTCAVFATNRDVPLDMVQGFTGQYTQRWQIENEYKTIKQHFLPTVASTDYRIRFLYFVIGVVMYNIWRVTNLLFRDAINIHLGEQPPIPAGEFIEILAFCIIPGD